MENVGSRELLGIFVEYRSHYSGSWVFIGKVINKNNVRRKQRERGRRLGMRA